MNGVVKQDARQRLGGEGIGVNRFEHLQRRTWLLGMKWKENNGGDFKIKAKECPTSADRLYLLGGTVILFIKQGVLLKQASQNSVLSQYFY